MNNYYLALILTLIASFSTLIGAIPIFMKIKDKDKLITSSLAFSSGVMLSISLLSLITESYSYFIINVQTTTSLLLIIIFNLIGFIISMFINEKLDRKLNNKLYKSGIFSLIVIILHNIPEGIITFLTTTINIKLGLLMFFSIMLHNIPEGISISIPIYYSTNSKLKALLYTFISGLSEFIGGVLSYLFLKRFINSFILAVILSITSGIMIYVSLFELLPASYKQKKIISIISFVFSVIITSICILFIF